MLLRRHREARAVAEVKPASPSRLPAEPINPTGPTTPVKDLAGMLSVTTDIELIKQWAAQDERKKAAEMYEARLVELAPVP